jgi:hypothetical protein
MNREGYYSIVFQGSAGWGAGMIVLDTGLVIGADPFGGKYDGTYTYNPATQCLDIKATVTIAAGGWSVNGVVAGSQATTFPVVASIPRGHVTGFQHTVQTPNGPINIVLNKVRDFPS